MDDRNLVLRAIGLVAVLALLLVGCAGPLVAPAAARCQGAGPPGSAAYQACMQAEYARAMQRLDYQAWLELTKGYEGGR
jgi:hypothetical protein